MAATVAKPTTCKFEHLTRLYILGVSGVRRLRQVTLFLGINSLVYYVIIGWLPAILISQGYSEAQAGSLHGLLQLATAAPGLLILTFLTSCERSAWYCSVRCLDVRSGRGWALLYASTRDHGLCFRFWFRRNNDTGVDVHWSSGKFCASGGGTLGMAQSVGYLLAACGPPLMGKIHDANGDWSVPLMGVAIFHY